jgi:hypothetical protein
MALLSLLAEPSGAQATKVVEAELHGKEFVTRTLLGNTHAFRPDYLTNDVLRRVDTEVHADGRIAFIAIRPNIETDGKTISLTGLLHGAFAIDRSKISISVPVGSRVKVEQIQWYDERLDIRMAVVPGDQYAKAKFVFGKGFQKTATRQSILRMVSRVLVLDEFERGERAEAEFPGIRRKYDLSKSTYDAARGADRLPAAEALRSALVEIVANRSGPPAVQGVRDPSEVAAYNRELARIDSAIVQLREEARVGRAREIESLLRPLGSRIDSLLTEARADRRLTAALWKEQAARLDSIQSQMDRHAALVDESASLGRPVAPELAAASAQRRGALDVARAAHERQRAAADRLQADEEYRSMDRRLVTLRDTYTRAFGTADFAAEANKYLALLQQMHDNRLAAAKSGNSAATAQAATLLQEIERTRLRLRRSP